MSPMIPRVMMHQHGFYNSRRSCSATCRTLSLAVSSSPGAARSTSAAGHIPLTPLLRFRRACPQIAQFSGTVLSDTLGWNVAFPAVGRHPHRARPQTGRSQEGLRLRLAAGRLGERRTDQAFHGVVQHCEVVLKTANQISNIRRLETTGTST